MKNECPEFLALMVAKSLKTWNGCASQP